jgi:hypothetical protein
MRVAAIVVAAACGSAAICQVPLRAELIANTPMVVGWQLSGPPPAPSGSATHAAGPLHHTGRIEAVTGSNNVYMQWQAPAGRSLRGRLNITHNTSLPPATTTSSGDWTLVVTGPAGTVGHVHIDLHSASDFTSPGNFQVDVHDDGSIEANTAHPTFSPYMHGVWDVPVVLGSAPLRVRILHGAGGNIPQGFGVSAEFVPWAEGATNLGSSCAVNEVGWIQAFPAERRSYFLSLLPANATRPARFAATGYGTLATFVCSDRDVRLPVGSIGLGSGCDDLLALPVLTDPGVTTGFGEWELPLPPLPPGIHLFLQHVSLGAASGGPPLRFGISNLVVYRT